MAPTWAVPGLFLNNIDLYQSRDENLYNDFSGAGFWGCFIWQKYLIERSEQLLLKKLNYFPSKLPLLFSKKA